MATDSAPEAPLPPGPDGWPVIGKTRAFASDRLGFVTRMARVFGDVVRIPIAGRTDFYALYHPDHIRHVLVENNRNYHKGEFFQRQLGFLGTGVLNADGEAWRRQRHLVEPAFHPERIEAYADPMVAFTERLIESYDDGEVRNVHGDMMRLTLAIVAKALFDVDIREAEADIERALEAVMAHTRRRTSRLVDFPDWVPTPGNREYHRAAADLEAVVDDIIDRRRGADDAGDVVSMLIDTEGEAGERLTDEQIRNEVMTLLLAGHETTAQALTYTLYLLAHHPGREERLLEELEAVLAGAPPTVEDVADLVYTERVVTESMRLYPPVWSIVREPIEDDRIGGYRIPAGETVAIYQWVTHRDSRFYDEPQRFHPDRWTDAFRQNLHPFAYIPFSAGPRRCLGDRFAKQEAVLVLATLLQAVGFEALSGEDLDLAPSITLRPADGVDLRVRTR